MVGDFSQQNIKTFPIEDIYRVCVLCVCARVCVCVHVCVHIGNNAEFQFGISSPPSPQSYLGITDIAKHLIYTIW